MSNYYLFILLIPVFYFLNHYLLKKKFLLDKIESSKHKKFLTSESVPLSGGILIIIGILFFIEDLNYIDKILFLGMFSLGLLSDMQKLKSPFVRLFLQSLIICILLFFNKNFLIQTRLSYFDYLIENFQVIKILFTLFCLLILINGTNFIDGVNGLSSGYFIVIILNIIFISKDFKSIDYYNLAILMNFLVVFYFFNLFSKSFLGDNGSYLISTYIGFYLIIFFDEYRNIISPYYICLLLWYPAFENLFSILRRKFIKRGFSTYADNEHLHHFLFKYLNQKIRATKFSNSLTGILINLVNLIFIFYGSNYLNNTEILVSIILFLICTYLFLYFFLKKKLKKKL